MNKFFYLFFPCFIFIISCKNEQQEEILKGDLLIYADEAFLPLINAESDVFTHFYKEAKVSVISIPSDSAVYKFMTEDVGMIAVSSGLTKSERDFLAKQNIVPEVYPVAFDAIVFIASKERGNLVLNQSQLKDIFSGKIRDWQMLGSQKGAITIVVNGKGSADLNYINEKFSLDSTVSFYAVGSEDKVIEYIASHPSAIGVTGLLSIRNKVSAFAQIKVLGVQGEDGKVSYPFQSDLASGAYPYKREILLISKYKTSLGTGLASYVLTEEGQRIVLKSGLLPAKMPGREVILKKEF